MTDVKEYMKDVATMCQSEVDEETETSKWSCGHLYISDKKTGKLKRYLNFNGGFRVVELNEKGFDDNGKPI